MFAFRAVTLAMAAISVSAASQWSFAQKACDRITPAVLTADGVPPVTKLDGPVCKFQTVSKWRRQVEFGELTIIPEKEPSGSPEAFEKLEAEWYSQHGRHCGLEVGLGKNAAWCGTGSAASLDYELLILRGNVISAIVLHNWIQPPNPARDMAMNLARDVFGPVTEEAPLVRPKD